MLNFAAIAQRHQPAPAPGAAAPLRATLFGPPTIRLGGHALSFRNRRAVALLVYLAVQGTPQGRTHLIDLLWPDSDDSHGRVNLRGALALLRHAVVDAGYPGADDLVVAHGDTLAIGDSARLLLDTELLDEAYQLATSPCEVMGDEEVSRLTAAVRCYVADFLHSFALADAPAFDDWATVQRERWHRRMGAVLDRLSLACLERGELPQAAEAAARWLAHDPLDEAAYRRRMAIELACGNRAGAAQTYAACRAMLQDELGIGLSPETEELAAQLQVAGPLTPPVPPPPPPPPYEHPEYGYDLAELAQAYRSASHQPAAILMPSATASDPKGLPGVFLSWARGQGAETLACRACRDLDALPFQPIVDALRPRIDAERAPDDLLDDIWLSELSRILPELHERYPDLPAPLPLTDYEVRYRLYEAIFQAVSALARRAPLVFVVEDLHRAGPDTLSALQYLARRLSSCEVPVLLVLSMAAAVTPGPDAERFLDALGRYLPLRHVADARSRQPAGEPIARTSAGRGFIGSQAAA